MIYFQCKLQRDNAETIAWIEARAAKAGNWVELKTADGQMWAVVEVYDFGLAESALHQKQANDRNALPSIAGR